MLKDGGLFLRACDICWYWWSVDSAVFSRQSLIPLRVPVAAPMCGTVVVFCAPHVCMAVDDHDVIILCKTYHKLVRAVPGSLWLGIHGGDPSSISRFFTGCFGFPLSLYQCFLLIFICMLLLPGRRVVKPGSRPEAVHFRKSGSMDEIRFHFILSLKGELCGLQFRTCIVSNSLYSCVVRLNPMVFYCLCKLDDTTVYYFTRISIILNKQHDDYSADNG